jgi:hypothetical protein
MADLNDVLADNRGAVLDLAAAAERSAATWTTPRAPGKWSPSQVVEHVAGGLEEAANTVSGAPSPSIPMPPAFLRPLLRLLFFNRILKKGVFPKGFKAVTIASRRGEIALSARADDGTPRGTVFVPFCFYEAAANMLTNPVLDPFGKIPEFKYCAVKLTKGGAVPEHVSFGGGVLLEEVRAD